jgi:hypothetical protein
MFIQDGHAHVFENDAGNPGDPGQYVENTSWMNFLTPTGNPNVTRMVFAATGSINLAGGAGDGGDGDRLVNLFTGQTPDWGGGVLHIHLSLPPFYHPELSPIVGTQGPYRADSVTPLITINEVDKGGDNHYGGWQVYHFGVVDWPLNPLKPGTTINPRVQCQQIELYAHILIKGSLFRMLRVGYSVMIAGVIGG